MTRTISFILCSILLVLAIAYGCGCARTVVIYHTQHNFSTSDEQYASSYQVFAQCLVSGQGIGSAVAVGPQHLITAKHVVEACEAREDITWRIRVRGFHGIVEVVVVKTSKDHDVVLLQVVGTKKLKVWSALSARVPHVGEQVCVLASTYGVSRIKKCGEVFKVRRDLGKFLVSLHVVPGNSGGPVYDAVGQVVGIVVAGRWQANSEFYGAMMMPGMWKDIWPK